VIKYKANKNKFEAKKIIPSIKRHYRVSKISQNVLPPKKIISLSDSKKILSLNQENLNASTEFLSQLCECLERSEVEFLKNS
jgi:hypothetical protein